MSSNIKLAIVGYREFVDYELFSLAVNRWISEHDIPSVIISGGCRGTDTLAERYALENTIPTLIYKPQFNGSHNLPTCWQYDKKAYIDRDRLIAESCTHMIAFPSKYGKGTQITINMANAYNKDVTILTVD